MLIIHCHPLDKEIFQNVFALAEEGVGILTLDYYLFFYEQAKRSTLGTLIILARKIGRLIWKTKWVVFIKRMIRLVWKKCYYLNMAKVIELIE